MEKPKNCIFSESLIMKATITSHLKLRDLKFCLLFNLILISFAVSAQDLRGCDTIAILKDTINVSGVVTNSSNIPVKHVILSISNRNNIVSGHTDSTGRFSLKGLRFKDTILVQATNFSKKIINNGSRILRIIIPSIDDEPANTIIKIEASEISKKEPINFIYADCGEDYLNYMPQLPAEFRGGYSMLSEFIKGKLIYPQHALEQNIEGDVIVRFVIGPDGTPKDFSIEAGLNDECDKAALEVLKKMPKWRPAIFYGRPVESPQSIAINFTIKRMKR